MTSDPPRSEKLPPGYDEECPYVDADLSTYPDWWLRNIEEFREFGMRPFRPPVLADGTVLPPVIKRLQNEYDVEVQFRSTDSAGQQWELLVDGCSIRAVEYERDSGGYSVFEISSADLRTAVQAAVTK